MPRRAPCAYDLICRYARARCLRAPLCCRFAAARSVTRRLRVHAMLMLFFAAADVLFTLFDYCC